MNEVCLTPVSSVEYVKSEWATYQVDHSFIVSMYRVAEFNRMALGRVEYGRNNPWLILFEHLEDAVAWKLTF